MFSPQGRANATLYGALTREPAGRIIVSVPSVTDDITCISYGASDGKPAGSAAGTASAGDGLTSWPNERGSPHPEVVRSLINGAYESVLLERRLQAVEELTRLEAETPPDPDQLALELGATHETCGLS